jgi:hypothetical protein
MTGGGAAAARSFLAHDRPRFARPFRVSLAAIDAIFTAA